MADPAGLVIRPARGADLAPLAAALGDGAFFADRFRRQQRRRGVLLGGWLGARPVACVYLWLERAEEWQIRALLPDVPLLNRVQVHPDTLGDVLSNTLVFWPPSLSVRIFWAHCPPGLSPNARRGRRWVGHNVRAQRNPTYSRRCLVVWEKRADARASAAVW